MAKEIKAKVKLQVPGGGATPARPVATLGQHGANIMEFCKQFNAKTADRKGQTVPVEVTIFVDKTFQFVIKTTPVTELIKKRAGIEKGSARPHELKVGSVTWRDIEEIAREKMPDLNAHDIEQAKKTIAGSARSMGINVVD